MAPVEIPSSPLIDLTKVKVFGSKAALERLQLAVDALTRKAKAGSRFTPEEKTFLVELFECFSLGGWAMGYSEAAALADHYVHGDGVVLQLDAAVYAGSAVVRDTQAAMKKHIQEQLIGSKGSVLTLHSADGVLLKRKEFMALMDKSRNLETQGRMLVGGWLLTEQGNQRLQKANNRFQLGSTSQVSDKNISTTWRVDDDYVFEPFAKGYYTDLHLRDKMVLRMPDGLSEYMTRIGIAKAFKHYAEWTELWVPEPAASSAPSPTRPAQPVGSVKKAAVGKKLPAQPLSRGKR